MNSPVLPIKEILFAIVISALILGIGSCAVFPLHDAVQVGYGILFAVFNQLFYAFITWAIFIKKNIASIVFVIVIKYAILLVAIYLVWAHGQALLFAMGMLAELMLTALTWLMLKQVLLKRTPNGPL